MTSQPPQPDAAIRDRAIGAFVGLAVGDATGTTLEFHPRGTFEPLTDMIGGGPFSLQPGQWTDDTAMAIALAESLLHSLNPGFDAFDCAERFCAWYRHGHYSCTGTCVDIGNTTRAALERFERRRDPLSGSSAPDAAGNGSLMRLAPVAIRYWSTPKHAADIAAQQSRITHGAPACLDACSVFARMLTEAIQGTPRSALLAPRSLEERYAIARATETSHGTAHAPDPSHSTASALDASHFIASVLAGDAIDDTDHPIASVVAGDWIDQPSDRIPSSGYVVDTLRAALWSVAHADNFRDAILTAVNLGDDADTVGAVTGQLAGALWGHQNIPREWRDKLAWHDHIHHLATALL